MNRNCRLAALCCACMFFFSFAATAAGLTVTNDEAGYNLTLPQGWEPLSEGYFGERKRKMLRMVPAGQREKTAATVRAVGRPAKGKDGYEMEIILFHYDKKAMDMGMSIPAGAMMPDRGERELFAMLLAEEAMGKKGAQRSASSVLPDGLRSILYWKDEKGETAVTVWDLRFTPEYLVTVIGGCRGQGGEQELLQRLSSVVIAPAGAGASRGARGPEARPGATPAGKPVFTRNGTAVSRSSKEPGAGR